jgi:hypothetical protein
MERGHLFARLPHSFFPGFDHLPYLVRFLLYTVLQVLAPRRGNHGIKELFEMVFPRARPWRDLLRRDLKFKHLNLFLDLINEPCVRRRRIREKDWCLRGIFLEEVVPPIHPLFHQKVCRVLFPSKQGLVGRCVFSRFVAYLKEGLQGLVLKLESIHLLAQFPGVLVKILC